MGEMEKQELADRIKAMEKGEKELTIRMLPTDLLIRELARRDRINTKMITNVRKAMHI